MMDNEEVEVDVRASEKIPLENIIKICEKCFSNLYPFRTHFNNFFLSCGLNEGEYNKLIKHLDGIRDILLEYCKDLIKTKEKK